MTDKQIIVDEINKTIEQEMENLRNIAKQQIGKLEAKLKAKEQECEELKKEIAFGNNGTLSDKIRAEVFKELNNESKQLSKALTQIKEIADKDFRHTAWEEYAKQLKQILQKISECEGNDEKSF